MDKEKEELKLQKKIRSQEKAEKELRKAIEEIIGMFHLDLEPLTIINILNTCLEVERRAQMHQEVIYAIRAAKSLDSLPNRKVNERVRNAVELGYIVEHKKKEIKER